MTRALCSILSLAGVLAIFSCAEDDNADTSSITCAGDGCSCVAANCTCSTDCHATCGDRPCRVTCAPGLKCNADSDLAVELECLDAAECKGNGGAGSQITCAASTKCELKAGPDSTAICSDGADCKFNLGAGSEVMCSDDSACDVKCADDCQVTCEPTADCALNCGPEDEAGVPGTLCPDGTLVCGECPPL